jgi:hypothetical protein
MKESRQETEMIKTLKIGGEALWSEVQISEEGTLLGWWL